jgi:hypothetical protein
VKEF